MLHNPENNAPHTLESLAAESRAIISNLPYPEPAAQVWSPEDLRYVSNRKAPILWDCIYIDKKGNDRCWVLYADNLKHVIQSFNEIVGEGRIVSILPAAEWD